MSVKKSRKHSSFVVYSYCSKQVTGYVKGVPFVNRRNVKRYLFSKKYYIINVILLIL